MIRDEIEVIRVVPLLRTLRGIERRCVPKGNASEGSIVALLGGNYKISKLGIPARDSTVYIQ